MFDNLSDWMAMLGRWAHIIFGIAWIGSSFFFNWLDGHFEPPTEDEKKKGKTGELFMVHGGGYYFVEKKLFGFGPLPANLHWFKWEATWTLISGYFLLGVVYYMGGDIFMVDQEVNPISGSAAIAIGISTLVVTWFLYDFTWRLFSSKGKLPIVMTAAIMVGACYLLTHTLSGRAAYMHAGAMIGTWMVLNVWAHIIPAQKKMLEQAQNGEQVDHSLGLQASFRSKHNNYFTLPVLFVMVSNHFPSTYGHDLNWVILIISFFVGAFIRHYFNIREKKDKYTAWIAIPVVLGLVTLIVMTNPETEDPVVEVKEQRVEVEVEDIEELQAANTPVSKIRHDVSVLVEFEGVVPARKKLKLPSACAKQYPKGARDTVLLVHNKKLQNVLVRVTSGHENLPIPPVPAFAVELDQKGCLYSPRVIGARVGQKVTLINSDPVFHNVKSVAKKNKRFNIAMPKKNQRKTKIFTKPEIVVKTKCSVHPWMAAYIAVVEHPYFGVTRKAGTTTLKGLAPGTYTVEAWHETLGTQDQQVVVGDDLVPRVKFTFKL
ncbi:MAG: hypothetical protein HN509_17150 [Halobacteriovoraceae bacterium]|nr:hypothetical protein [Halobacteriovoraceae bacterium]MBT5095780.1 hypothetical protein [Halobacteriovoraceae bacterium]